MYVALLTPMLLGQWLHKLQDHCAGHQVTESVNPTLSVHCHGNSCGHGHPPLDADLRDHETQDPPFAPHDHSSCVICNFLAHLVSSPVMAVAPSMTEPLFERHQPESEFAAAVRQCRPIARGPPAEWVVCC